MPAKSKAQQRFMGMVHALQKGEIKPSDVSDKVKKAADSMSDKDAEDFASTKHKGLPKKVKEALLRENPAAAAAAAMVMIQMQNPDTGNKVKAITPLRNKDHKLHGKAKGIFKRLKDKFSKKSESVEEGFGGDLKGSDKKKFEKARKENAEQLGYELTGTSDIKESVNEGINDKMKKIMTKLAKSLSIKSVVDMYTGKGSLSYFLDDEKEALKLQKFLQKSFKRVRKINLDKSKGDTANFVVAADMLGLESVNEAGLEMNKLKDAIKMFQKKIKKQGRVTNARDEEHLKNLIKVYKQMGGKGVKESVNEGKKRYYQQDRVGSAKYTISYHDGKKKHKDGSDFFDIKIFRNKKDLAKFVNTLSKSGYVYGFNESVSEAPITSPSQLPYSSPEAQKMAEKDIIGMSKILGKASQMSIKKMMDGVKAKKYDAFDLQRAIMSGPIRDTHTGERDFMRVLWNKVRSGFRRYSKRGKLR